MSKVIIKLKKLSDEKHQKFSSSLIPNIDKKLIIGVKTPELKKIAREMSEKEKDIFLNTLPHKYFEENQIHAFLLSFENDYDKAIKYVEKFLRYVDNWATCDQLLPKTFKKNKFDLLKYIEKWLKSQKTYTVRFAIGMLMKFFLDEDFDEVYLKKVSKIKSDEYYINMMIAWYFATALAKQYDSAIKYIKNFELNDFVHNKTIQKAIESFRVSDKHKLELKKYKINKI